MMKLLLIVGLVCSVQICLGAPLPLEGTAENGEMNSYYPRVADQIARKGLNQDDLILVMQLIEHLQSGSYFEAFIDLYSIIRKMLGEISTNDRSGFYAWTLVDAAEGFIHSLTNFVENFGRNPQEQVYMETVARILHATETALRDSIKEARAIDNEPPTNA